MIMDFSHELMVESNECVDHSKQKNIKNYNTVIKPTLFIRSILD